MAEIGVYIRLKLAMCNPMMIIWQINQHDLLMIEELLHSYLNTFMSSFFLGVMV